MTSVSVTGVSGAVSTDRVEPPGRELEGSGWSPVVASWSAPPRRDRTTWGRCVVASWGAGHARARARGRVTLTIGAYARRTGGRARMHHVLTWCQQGNDVALTVPETGRLWLYRRAGALAVAVGAAVDAAAGAVSAGRKRDLTLDGAVVRHGGVVALRRCLVSGGAVAGGLPRTDPPTPASHGQLGRGEGQGVRQSGYPLQPPAGASSRPGLPAHRAGGTDP